MVYLCVVFQLYFVDIFIIAVVHVIVNGVFMYVVETDELERINTRHHCHNGIDRLGKMNDRKPCTLPGARGNVKNDQYSRILRILMVFLIESMTNLDPTSSLARIDIGKWDSACRILEPF